MPFDAPALSDRAWAEFDTRLRAYVRRRVDPLWADDVTGDILLRLLRHRGDLAAADRPLAWVRRVAANAIADHHRRRAAERRALDAAARDRAAESPIAAEDDGADAAAEIARSLRPFIRALPPAYAEVLQLTEIDGMTQAAAAERLGLSLPAVKARVRRGRARLKQALRRCCAIELDRRGAVRACVPRGPKTSGCGDR